MDLIATGTLTHSGTTSFDGASVFNDSGAAVDFRVEGDTDQNLLFIDASADYVGIGDNTPTYKLDVSGNARFTGAVVLDSTLTLAGALSVDDTTDATSGTTGSIQTDGGIGIAKNLWVDGDTITLNGTAAMRMSSPTSHSMLIRSGTSTVTGVGNSGFGSSALSSLTDGTYNTAIGFKTMASASSADYSIAIGDQAMGIGAASGQYNVAIGSQSLEDLTTGNYNTAVGSRGLAQLTTGSYNIAVGFQPMLLGVMTGNQNIGIGNNALLNATTANNSIAIGNSPMSAVVTGTDNTGIGRDALNDLTSGTYNVAMGYQTMFNATTASYGIALGYQAMGLGVVTGTDNYAIGRDSLYDVTSGTYNTAFGYLALTDVTTGDENIGIGKNAGDVITTGARNILIAKDTDPQAAGNNDELNIGNTIYGDLANDYIGIGTFPTYTLDVSGNAQFAGHVVPSGNVTIDLGSSDRVWRDIYTEDLIITSDRRKKDDITELENGLDKVMALRPVSYHLKGRAADERHIGLIAQEVQDVVAEAVKVGNDPEKSMAVRYHNLVPVLIKAAQEQNEVVKGLKDENHELKKRLQRLEKLLLKK